MDTIAVLDFGGQYAHLIANRIRRLSVYSEIFDSEVSADRLRHARGIILSGGPSGVYEKEAPKYDAGIFGLGVPVLGICYGHQLIAKHFGGTVVLGNNKEYGVTRLKILSRQGLFKGLGAEETVWMSHGDEVTSLPKDFQAIASSGQGSNAAIANRAGKIFGIQFHAEVTHTEHGMKILDNFLDICGCSRDWKIGDVAAELTGMIKDKVAGRKVFLLVSGGVDSTVAFALLNKALGKSQVYGLHIDTGLMRKNESSEIHQALLRLGFDNLKVVNAGSIFLERLADVVDPELKRHIIGQTFIDVLNETIGKFRIDSDNWMIAQGTIYPDTIETGRTRHSAVIKTHHNRVPVIDELIGQGKLIERLEQFYKDEVRALGERLGLPHELVWRHPFPGPGLAVRIICEETASLPENLTDIKSELSGMLPERMTAEILPVQSVGVQGDSRTYRNPVALSGPLDWKKLEEVSSAITNKIREINRVVYTLSPERIKSVEFLGGTLTGQRISLLQELDSIANEVIRKHGLYEKIWMMPVVLVPVSVDGSSRESVVLRPVYSREAMTARFVDLPEKVCRELAAALTKPGYVSGVFIDVTHKPPATIEWE